MLRSRVSSTVDFARLSAAISRPGIDPRVWVSYAIVTAEPVIDTSAAGQDAGVFVDLVLLPTQMQATARVGALYAGNGFGLYTPLHTDDEVLVVAPSGDPAEGLVVTQRLWSPSDLPPQAVADHPEDVSLVIETGKSLRVTVQGGGNVVLAVDSGKVYLGAEDGTEPVALGTTLQNYLNQLQPFFTGFNAWVPVPQDGGAALQAAVTAAYATAAQTIPEAAPAVEAATTEVK